jgi:nucleotide-binding universal stress UspA family protein
MGYKTILVHADLSDAAPSRVRCAARLARQSDAHLIGAAPTGISRFVPPEVLAAGLNPLAERCRTLREEAQQALDRFSHLAQQEGVPSYEARLIDDDVDGGMPIQARYCDLAIVARPDRTVVDPLMPADLPERLVLAGGHPVLILPDSGHLPALDGEALIAWNGSAEATRAVAGALPLLRQARRVTVLGIGNGLPPTGLEHEPCTALAEWLGRHGITAFPRRRSWQDASGKALLAEAIETGATLLVMGAYGHSPLREALTDGVTATVLRWGHLAVLLAH